MTALISLRKGIIPAPKTSDLGKPLMNWQKFCASAHRSIGRNLGGGVVTFSGR
jgi:hypothetical protein